MEIYVVSFDKVASAALNCPIGIVRVH